MTDFLSNAEIDLSCPSCDKKFSVKLKQIEQEEEIKCPYCNATIKLQDKNHGVKEANKALEKLTESLNKTIKINIKL